MAGKKKEKRLHCGICTSTWNLEQQVINGHVWYRCKDCTKLGRQLPIGRR